jgi:hypothetical protein
MKLLLELRENRHPSEEKIKELYRLVREMGLKETNFRELRVRLIYPHKNAEGSPEVPSEKIVFQGKYREIYGGDTAENVCILSVVLQKVGGKLFGLLQIADPLRPGKFIALTEEMSYGKFLKILDKAQDIGALHQDIRAVWFKYNGWRELLGKVQHI